ncbi:MAG: glycosyltransferase [Oscillospiraceae bacterium]|nr:glycosyltransferase [Oscillospiraceae bacterium]
MVQKKKILFVVEAMGGGVFTYIVDLANELVKTYDMTIAYATRPQTPSNYRSYFDERIQLIKVKHFTRAVNPAKDIKALLEIRKIAKDVNPDIIHLHSSKAGALGRIAFAGWKIPLYYTPHGYSFLMEDYNPVKRNLFGKTEALLAKGKCTTISCSYGEHLETLKLTPNADWVNNGINTDTLDKILSGTPAMEHPFTVFTVGRICPQKNPKLFNQIALNLPELKFLWIGDGELREELTAENIEITGWLERRDAIARCVNADVFLLTSLWEGMPISLLEAMYMQKLCVVNDVIGSRDVIQNEKNGFVCQTVEEFCAAVTSRQTDKLIQIAREDVKREYNTTVMAEHYSSIYEGNAL